MINKELDGATLHFLSKKGIHIPNSKLERMKAEMDALWENHKSEIERIEKLPKELLHLEIKYRK